MGADLSEVLPALLEAKGMTQEQLGERARISRTDINLICNGRSVGPARLGRIAEALEIDVSDFEGLAQRGAPKNPLRAELAAIRKAVEAKNLRESDTEKRLDGHLNSQTALLADIGAVQDRLEVAVSALVTVAERLDRASATLARQAGKQRPA